jgi:DNA primase
LEFAALMEMADPADGDALRAVAVALQSRFFPEGTSSRPKPAVAEKPQPAARELPVVVNAPMDFELKGLDHGHEYLRGRGFSAETMSYFGVGFCLRGMLKDRIAIPLHDGEGRLIGFAGRMADDSAICDGNPKYLFPSRRERNGTIYAFDKSLVVYNGHRQKAPCDDLIVVQGIPAVWWLCQHGFPRTVSLMGAECSDEQVDAITGLVKPGGCLWLMTDGTEAGDGLARIALGRFAQRRAVRWARLERDKQPTDLASAELERCLTA